MARTLSAFERTGRLQRKIDVFLKVPGGCRYLHSTNWHRTCREAVAAAAAATGHAASDMFARFDRRAR